MPTAVARSTKPRETDTSPSTDLGRFQAALHAGTLGATGFLYLLGLPIQDTPALLQSVRKGIPYAALARLQRNLAFPLDQVASLMQVPARTLARRREERRLRPEESDKLLRVARLLGQALQLFGGDWTDARAWLGTPQPTLGNVTPLKMAETELGAREVEMAIYAIRHGVFA
ncbi:MAG TPA: antitoxin Xre-like helix-turn-helix domain-containing protein [Candidatus Methylomirabilis sp.]|nr:antitoxin Xre-like helix-turn-helix domain-containing protein [Candidatus Methylomirabilis sp.]